MKRCLLSSPVLTKSVLDRTSQDSSSTSASANAVSAVMAGESFLQAKRNVG